MVEVVCLLAVLCFFLNQYRWSVREWEVVRSVSRQGQGAHPLPSPRVTLASLGFTREPLPRLRKVALGDSELDSIERIEYVEVGLRVSKRCYTYRTRSVRIELRVPRSHEEKGGVIALVRVEDPPPGRHAFQPLMGVWHVFGVIPGALYEHHYLTTLFDTEHLNAALMATYQQQGVRECVHLP